MQGSAGASLGPTKPPYPSGKPMRVLALHLPTYLPELNPIESIFHTLMERLWSWYRNDPDGFERGGLLKATAMVMDGISHRLIEKTAWDCSYTANWDMGYYTRK